MKRLLLVVLLALAGTGWHNLHAGEARPLAADEMPPMWSPEQRRQREQVRRDLRADLATLSPKGELIIALRSGHFVHQDEPSLVLEAVRKVVVEWRREGNPR